MSMDLETALEVVEGLRAPLADVAHLPRFPNAAREAEALRLVLDAARSASVVDLTNAAVARAREMTAEHPFMRRLGRGLEQGPCLKCGAPESDPIHQKPETP